MTQVQAQQVADQTARQNAAGQRGSQSASRDGQFENSRQNRRTVTKQLLRGCCRHARKLDARNPTRRWWNSISIHISNFKND